VGGFRPEKRGSLLASLMSFASSLWIARHPRETGPGEVGRIRISRLVIGPFFLCHPLRQSGRLTLLIWSNSLHECLIPPINLGFTASQPNREKESLLRDWYERDPKS
jgi:hypothetical protein